MLAIDPPIVSKAQDLANRIWAGQSCTEDRLWRISRVKEGLAKHGYTMDGVVL